MALNVGVGARVTASMLELRSSSNFGDWAFPTGATFCVASPLNDQYR